MSTSTGLGRILIIDDDPSFGALVSATAEARGFQAHYAPSLLELGSFARIKDYDIALIDYFLESLRGDEIAQYVEMFFHQVPVVIVSSRDFEAWEIEHWPGSVRKFVSKSSGVEKIIDSVVGVLDRERFLRRFDTAPTAPMQSLSRPAPGAP